MTVPGPTELSRALGATGPLDGAAWMFFVPPLTQRLVLCIETGLGAASLAAAQHAAHVYCLHPDPGLVQAIAGVADAQRARNLDVLLLPHEGRLPFADGWFDVAAVHAAGPRGAEGSLWTRRRWLLGELVRVLKPGGVFHLDGYRRGLVPSAARSEAASVPVVRAAFDLWRFGLRPRRVVRRWEADGRPYRAATLLRRHALPRDLASVAGVALNGARLGLVAGAPGTTLLDAILAQVPDADPKGTATLHFGSGHAFRIQASRLVFRLPRGEGALRRCRNNAAALARLGGLSLPFVTPRPAGEGAVEGQPFLIETRLHGREIPYLRLSRRAVQDVSVEASRMLTALHTKTRRRVALDGPAFQTLFRSPLAALEGDASATDLGACLRETASLLERRFLHEPIDLVTTHGDFKITNLVADASGRAIGVVDWDLSQEAGLPGMDLILYRAFDRVLLLGESFAQAILHVAQAGPGDDPVIRDYCGQFRIDPRGWRAYGLLTLAHYFVKLLGIRPGAGVPWSTADRATVLAACRQLTD